MILVDRLIGYPHNSAEAAVALTVGTMGGLGYLTSHVVNRLPQLDFARMSPQASALFQVAATLGGIWCARRFGEAADKWIIPKLNPTNDSNTQFGLIQSKIHFSISVRFLAGTAIGMAAVRYGAQLPLSREAVLVNLVASALLYMAYEKFGESLVVQYYYTQEIAMTRLEGLINDYMFPVNKLIGGIVTTTAIMGAVGYLASYSVNRIGSHLPQLNFARMSPQAGALFQIAVVLAGIWCARRAEQGVEKYLPKAYATNNQRASMHARWLGGYAAGFAAVRYGAQLPISHQAALVNLVASALVYRLYQKISSSLQ